MSTHVNSCQLIELARNTSDADEEWVSRPHKLHGPPLRVREKTQRSIHGLLDLRVEQAAYLLWLNGDLETAGAHARRPLTPSRTNELVGD